MTTIRPATPADEPWLLALTARLADFPVPAWRTPGEIVQADHRILLAALRTPSPDQCVLVAEDPPRTRCGYVFCTTRTDYFTAERHTHIEVLALEEQAQGKGLARRLMDAAEAWARDRGHRWVTLNVFDRNTRARGLYERLGYAPETVHYLKAVSSEK